MTSVRSTGDFERNDEFREKAEEAGFRALFDQYMLGNATEDQVLSELDEEQKPIFQSFLADCDGDNEKQAAEIDWASFRKKFDEGDVAKKEVDAQIAQAFLKHYHFKTPEDNETLWVFTNPTYEKKGKQLVKQQLRQHLDQHIRKNDVSEILDSIKAHTYFERPEGRELAHIIPLKNGYYNLDTDQFHSPNPDYFLTNEIPIEYDPEADCPEIKAFIRDIVEEEYVDTIQELFGYLLYSDYPISKAFMLLGEGKNGKSQLLDLMRKFLGEENVAPASLQQISENSFATAELYGKLANICGDLDARELETTGAFKTLTGGDLVRAERKYESAFSFYNYAKLVYSANDLPKTPDTSDAFFRRWIIINFPYRFTEDPDPDDPYQKEKIPKIVEQITTDAELSGLFNWALTGLKRLLANGQFTTNPDMEEIKLKWLAKTKPLEAFCEQFIEVDYGNYVTKDELYRMYQKFCEMHSAPMQSKSWVGRRLKEIVPEAVTTQKRIMGDNRQRVWENIALSRQTVEDEEDDTDEGDGESGKEDDTTNDSLGSGDSLSTEEQAFTSPSRTRGRAHVCEGSSNACDTVDANATASDSDQHDDLADRTGNASPDNSGVQSDLDSTLELIDRIQRKATNEDSAIPIAKGAVDDGMVSMDEAVEAVHTAVREDDDLEVVGYNRDSIRGYMRKGGGRGDDNDEKGKTSPELFEDYDGENENTETGTNNGQRGDNISGPSSSCDEIPGEDAISVDGRQDTELDHEQDGSGNQNAKANPIEGDYELSAAGIARLCNDHDDTYNKGVDQNDIVSYFRDRGYDEEEIESAIQDSLEYQDGEPTTYEPTAGFLKAL